MSRSRMTPPRCKRPGLAIAAAWLGAAALRLGLEILIGVTRVIEDH